MLRTVRAGNNNPVDNEGSKGVNGQKKSPTLTNADWLHITPRGTFDVKNVKERKK